MCSVVDGILGICFRKRSPGNSRRRKEGNLQCSIDDSVPRMYIRSNWLRKQSAVTDFMFADVTSSDSNNFKFLGLLVSLAKSIILPVVLYGCET
jgi:hypothetical protein